MAAEDVNTQTGTITAVETNEQAGFHNISYSPKDNKEVSGAFGLDVVYGVVPRVGDDLTIYITETAQIRGLDINGVEVFHRTEEEQEEYALKQAEAVEAAQKEQFENNKDGLDKKFLALPQVFQDRIQKRRDNNPEFRWRFEAYEMFCCEEAVKLANILKEDTKLQKFAQMDNLGQKQWVPFLKYDEHSGNTWGCTVALAHWYLTEPKNVVLQYGALAPLVGSVEYGDFSPEEVAELEAAQANAT